LLEHPPTHLTHPQDNSKTSVPVDIQLLLKNPKQIKFLVFTQKYPQIIKGTFDVFEINIYANINRVNMPSSSKSSS